MKDQQGNPLEVGDRAIVLSKTPGVRARVIEITDIGTTYEMACRQWPGQVIRRDTFVCGFCNSDIWARADDGNFLSGCALLKVKDPDDDELEDETTTKPTENERKRAHEVGDKTFLTC